MSGKLLSAIFGAALIASIGTAGASTAVVLGDDQLDKVTAGDYNTSSVSIDVTATNTFTCTYCSLEAEASASASGNYSDNTAAAAASIASQVNSLSVQVDVSQRN